MGQPEPETDCKHDSPPGDPDTDDRKDSLPPSNGRSLEWIFTSKPALVTLLALAGWGAWSLGYQLLLLLSDMALWLLVAFMCAALVVTHKYWRPRFDRTVEPLLGSKGKESKGSRRESRPFLDGVWQTVVVIGFMACFLVVAIKGEKEQQNLEPKQEYWPPPPGSRVTPQVTGRVADRESVNFASQYSRKRQATAMYWQTAVANLHEIRFVTPSGQEPAEQYFEHVFQQLRSLTNAARSAPTRNVDADLMQMAKRHLAVEDQYLELKTEMDELMKQQQIPSFTDTVDQRMELTQVILNLLATNPDAIETLPPGPALDYVKKCIALEETRQEQYREIEIMQAILQERYKGTAFSLPTVDQQ